MLKFPALCHYVSFKATTQNASHHWLRQRCPQNRSRHVLPRWPRSGTRLRRPWSPGGSVGYCLAGPETCLHGTMQGEGRTGSQAEAETERGDENKRTTAAVNDREKRQDKEVRKTAGENCRLHSSVARLSISTSAHLPDRVHTDKHSWNYSSEYLQLRLAKSDEALPPHFSQAKILRTMHRN